MNTERYKEVIEKLKSDYEESDVCMYDFLADVSVKDYDADLTIEGWFEIYCYMMNWAENDAFLRVNEEDEFAYDVLNNEFYKYNEVIK